MSIKNDGGLLIDERSNRVIGYLLSIPGIGVFSPKGEVSVDESVVEKHNEMLSRAEILGLDKCEVGQRGSLYYRAGGEGIPRAVTTWTGAVVAEGPAIHLHGRKKAGITFVYNGKMFQGRLIQTSDCFNFKRIS